MDNNSTVPRPSAAEINQMSWASVRAVRDSKLSETDWTQVADAPLSAEKKQEFTAYRQALRDHPQNHDNPVTAAANWPKKPT